MMCTLYIITPLTVLVGPYCCRDVRIPKFLSPRQSADFDQYPLSVHVYTE